MESQLLADCEPRAVPKLLEAALLLDTVRDQSPGRGCAVAQAREDQKASVL